MVTKPSWFGADGYFLGIFENDFESKLSQKYSQINYSKYIDIEKNVLSVNKKAL